MQHPKATFREIEAALDERLARLRARMLEDTALVSRAADWSATDAEAASVSAVWGGLAGAGAGDAHAGQPVRSPHTRLHMLTPSQMHAGQSACVLANRAALKVATLATREADPSARFFTWAELIAQPLPDVSDYPIYTWAGLKIVPRNMRHLLANSPANAFASLS